jgi:hypothetical protein
MTSLGDEISSHLPSRSAARGASCVLCALDYPSEMLDEAYATHLFVEQEVVFVYPCPIRYAQLPDAVFRVPGLPILTIRAQPPC